MHGNWNIKLWISVIVGQEIGPTCSGKVWQVTRQLFLQQELPALSEKFPLQTRRQMCYQHDGAPRHFSQVISQYLNQQFPNRWIGRSGEQNLSPRSPDLNPLDYHVWGCTKAMVCARKFSTMREPLQRILTAARSISNAAVPNRVTSSLVTRVSECIHRDVSHFEQLAWVVNYGTQTIHLATNLNKWAVNFFTS